MKTLCTIAAVILLTAPLAQAVETTVNPAGPVISDNTVMGGIMVQVILGLFLAAATIGPLVAILMPQEAPGQDDHVHNGAH